MNDLDTLRCTRRLALTCIAGLFGQMTGCGGSFDVAGLSNGGTGSFNTGTVTGLGSIIVNGVRYHIDDAQLLTSDGAPLSASALQLGMVVEVESAAITPATSSMGWPEAVATRVTGISGWVGPVGTISRASQQSTFELLGCTIEVLPNTLFSGTADQFSELTSGHFAEVYGYLNFATGQVLASRVNVSDQAPAQFKLNSLVEQVNLQKLSVLLKKQLTDESTAGAQLAQTLDALMVQIKIDPQANDNNWRITDIRAMASQLLEQAIPSNYEIEIFGGITDFSSADSFSVNGIPINAQSARITGTFALGKYAKVQGRIDTRLAQIIANTVQEITPTQMSETAYEFYGQISQVTSQTFVIKGQPIAHNNSAAILALAQLPQVLAKVTVFRDGAQWQLANVTVL